MKDARVKSPQVCVYLHRAATLRVLTFKYDKY